MYDYGGHHLRDERDRKTIPRYSTEEKAFSEIERRGKEFGVYDLYVKFLLEEGQDETTATLEQKCVAILKARKSQLKEGGK